MFAKKKAKQIIEEKLDLETPEVPGFDVTASRKVRSPKWWVYAVSGLALVGVSIGAGFGIFNLLNNPRSVDLNATQMTHPVKPANRTYSGVVSAKSAEIYEAFAQKLVPLIFAGVGDQSMAFSVFDAFVAVSMTVYCSSDEVQSSYSTLLGASSMSEVTKAVQELTLTLGTNVSYVDPYDHKTKTSGGASVNSFWLKDTVPLAEGAEDVLSGLQNDYYASVYHTAASTDGLKGWLSDNAPAGFDDLPKLQLDDPPDTASVSAFFVRDNFDVTGGNSNPYQTEYESKQHYLDYTLGDGTHKQVDYIESSYPGPVYTGTSFTGVHGHINKLGLDYYLPDAGTKPQDIMADVIAENYEPSASNYRLCVSAPYFLIRTENLNFTENLKTMDSLFEGILMQKLVDPSAAQVLSEALQSSVLKYDFTGFYAVSITVVATDTGVEADPKYDFKLDRPHVFNVTYPLTLSDGITHARLPLFYGQVYDPAYPQYGGPRSDPS